jgi:hypothetical protein
VIDDSTAADLQDRKQYNLEYSGENDGDEINVSTVPGGASNQNGAFTDARTRLGATSGIGIANMALGLADAYTEIGPRSLTIFRGWMHEAFAQDSWKVSDKLHLEYAPSSWLKSPFRMGSQSWLMPPLRRLLHLVSPRIKSA